MVEGYSGKETPKEHDPTTLRVALFRRSKLALICRSVPLERFIEEQPLTSVLIAAGVGMFLGRFWTRP